MTQSVRSAAPARNPWILTLRRAAVLVGLVAPLAGTIYAIFHLNLATTKDVVTLVVLYLMSGLGITIGFHRLLTHRSFKTHPVIKFLFLAMGSMAIQGPALHWAATHLRHHAHTDEEGDPHSPWKLSATGGSRSSLMSFLHSHLLWMFRAGVAEADLPYLRRMPADRAAILANRTFVLWAALGLLIPYWIGGWQTFIWGGLVRIFLVHHVTWSVNSVCHVFGRRDFDTPDQSRNNLLVSWLAMGEGSHNTHHAYPGSAQQGIRWWEIDLSYRIIRGLEIVGLAWDVKRVPNRCHDRVRSAATAHALEVQETVK